MTSGATSVSVEDLTKRFGDVLAVDAVSFDVGVSEFFSLLGPSGCGKTTTLRMLAGFERPTEGRILLEGRDATKLAPFKRNANMVFQNYALFPHMTVAENVAFGPQRKRLSKKEVRLRAGEALEAVRLDAFASRYPKELSGGQQQRVALARALANQPAVLLLDEPLGALDLKLREGMQFELKRIQQDVGISFVYVTHDQNEAMTMSDRIAVMNRGRVEHLGSPEEIYLRPSSLFVAGFIGQTSLLPCTVVRTGADVEVRLPDGSSTTAGGADARCVEGDEAIMVLRPEHMRLSSERPADKAVSMEVRVGQEVFQGAVIRYRTTASDGTSLSVIAPLDERLPTDRSSDVAWISWDPAYAYVLPADELEGDGDATGDALVEEPSRAR
ncbi:MAG: ABC transporter ATP-binding protein [Actinomycetota bacterium]